MAEQDKNHEPSLRKQARARADGVVVSSPFLEKAVLVLVLCALCPALFGTILVQLRQRLISFGEQTPLSGTATAKAMTDDLGQQATTLLSSIGSLVGPAWLLLAIAVAMARLVASQGPVVVWGAPKRSVFRSIVLALVGVAVLVLVAITTIRPMAAQLIALRSPSQVATWCNEQFGPWAAKLAGVFLVLAVVDFVWARRVWWQSLRMSRAEVEQERKDSEVSPELRDALKNRD